MEDLKYLLDRARNIAQRLNRPLLVYLISMAIMEACGGTGKGTNDNSPNG